MPNMKTIGMIEFESLISSLDRKPYLLIVANKTKSKKLASTDGIQSLNEFNQKEIMKDRTPVFILGDPESFRDNWKGFMWVFTIQSTKELNPAIPDMVQVYRIS